MVVRNPCRCRTVKVNEIQGRFYTPPSSSLINTATNGIHDYSLHSLSLLYFTSREDLFKKTRQVQVREEISVCGIACWYSIPFIHSCWLSWDFVHQKQSSWLLWREYFSLESKIYVHLFLNDLCSIGYKNQSFILPKTCLHVITTLRTIYC